MGIIYILFVHGLVVVSVGIVLALDARSLSKKLSPLLIGLGIQSCDVILYYYDREFFEIILMTFTFFNLFFSLLLFNDLKFIIIRKLNEKTK